MSSWPLSTLTPNSQRAKGSEILPNSAESKGTLQKTTSSVHMTGELGSKSDKAPKETQPQLSMTVDESAAIVIHFDAEKRLRQGAMSICELLKRYLRGINLSAKIERVTEDQLCIIVSGSDVFFTDFAERILMSNKLKSGRYAPFVAQYYEDFVGSDNPKNVFTVAEKERMIHEALNKISISKVDQNSIAGIRFQDEEPILSRLLRDGVVTNVVAIHQDFIRHQIDALNVSSSYKKLHEALRCYYGEKVAFHYAWFDHYSNSLLFPSVLGFVQLTFQSYGFDQTLLKIAVFCLTMFWATISLERWKKKSLHYIMEWGLDMTLLQETQRSAFSGEWVYDVASKAVIKKTHTVHQYLRLTFGYIFTLLLAIASAYFSIAVTLHFDILHESFYQRIAQACLVSVCILGASHLYRLLQDHIMIFENHEFPSQFENHSAAHRVVFEIPNRFSVFAFIAHETRNSSVLSDYLVVFLVFCQIYGYIGRQQQRHSHVNNAVHAFKSTSPDTQPKKPSMSENQNQKVDQVLSRVRNDSKLKMQNNNFEYYLESVIQFVFVLCFLSITPLVAIVSLGLNFVSRRARLHNLSFSHQKPVPVLSRSIGPWIVIMEMLSMASVLIGTIMLIVVDADLESLIKGSSPTDMTRTVIIFEHVVIFGKILLHCAIPKSAPEIEKGLQSRYAIQEKAMSRNKATKETKVPPSDASVSELKKIRLPDFSLPACLVVCYFIGFSGTGLLFVPALYFISRAFANNEEEHSAHDIICKLNPTYGSGDGKTQTSESAEWFNQFIFMMWAKLSRTIESFIATEVGCILDEVRPSSLTTLFVKEVSLGDISPRFQNIQDLTTPRKPDIVFECDLHFNCDGHITITAGTDIFSFDIKVDGLIIRFKQLRVTMKTIPQNPFISQVSMHTDEVPTCDVSVHVPLVGDLSDIPPLKRFILEKVKNVLYKQFVQKPFTISLAKESREIPFDLVVTLKEGRNFPTTDLDGLSDPYCVISIDKESKTSDIRYNSLNPLWNQTFTFPVSYCVGLGVQRELSMKFYDHNIPADEYVGTTTIPLGDLKPGLSCEKLLDLFDSTTGLVSVSLLLKPKEDFEENEGLILVSIKSLNNPSRTPTRPIFYVCVNQGANQKSNPQRYSETSQIPVTISMSTPNITSGKVQLFVYEEPELLLGKTHIDLSKIVPETENNINLWITDDFSATLDISVKKSVWSQTPQIVPVPANLRISVADIRNFVTSQTAASSDTILSKTAMQITKTLMGPKKPLVCLVRVGCILRSMSIDPQLRNGIDIPLDDHLNQHVFIYIAEKGDAPKDALGEVVIPVSSLPHFEKVDTWYPIKSSRPVHSQDAPELRVEMVIIPDVHS